MMDNMKDHPLYRKHDIDSAMNALWAFYKGRFVALFLISLVISGILQYATMLIDFKSLYTVTDPALVLEKLKSYMVPMLIFMVAGLLSNTIMHYYILHKPIDSSMNIFISIVKSLKYFIPYLILMVLFACFAVLAIVLGVFVLFIGAIFAALYVGMLSFFILPVMMAEEANIQQTISRTIKLAHSGFWANMGWSSIFFVLYLIISIVLSGVVLLPFAGSFMKTFANPQDTSSIMHLPNDPLFLFLSSAINALTLPLSPIFGFIIYFNGKAKEESSSISFTGNDNGEQKVRVEDLYAKPREENNFDQPPAQG